MAPAVRPSTILFWKAITRIIKGIMTVMVAAAISPQGISWSPGKRTMATGMVLEAVVEVNVRANRNSFQEKINTKMAVAEMPGAHRGKSTL